ncbi:MAG: cupin domain-containing protein [Rhodoferax sp.]
MPESAQSPIALMAADTEPRRQRSLYPEPFASQMAGRTKRVLGDRFGLRNFGVNLTELAPGGVSALRHAHSHQDEFVYVLQGTPTLLTNAGETLLLPGMCAGFAAGTGDTHQLANRSAAPVVYLEVGDRSAGDAVTYPDDDLRADFVQGGWCFSHKNGEPYA